MKKNLPFKFFTVFLFLLMAGYYTFAQSTVFISQVTDPADHYQGRYVQLYNSGKTAVDLGSGNYYLVKQANGGNYYNIALTGTIQPDGVYVVAGYSDFSTYYSGYNADQTNGSLTGNGDDGYYLYKGGDNTSGTLIDAYGVPNVQASSSDAWYYQDGVAIRNSNIGTGNSTWSDSEWTVNLGVNTTDLDPSTHTYNSGSDVTPPTWSSGYPKTIIVEDTRAIISVKTDEEGMAYVITVPHGSSAPTPDEVKAGIDYGSVNVVTADSITIASVEIWSTKVISGLTVNTAYDLWIVARDNAGNLQDAPTSLSITTTGSRSLTLTNPKANDEAALGDSIQISWTSTNIDSLVLGAYSFSTQELDVVTNYRLDAGKGSYKLEIPYEADTGFYTLYIADAYDSTFYDSVSPLHIVDNRILTWVEPQTEDTVYVGDTLTFKWTASHVDSILIGGYNYGENNSFMITGDLDHNDAAHWKPVAASDGSYEFYLAPDKVGGSYTLAMKLYDAKDTSFNVTAYPVYILDTLPLKLAYSAPIAGMTDFPASAPISCTFTYDSIKPGTGKVYIRNLSDGAIYQSIDASSLNIQGDNFYFMPNPALVAGDSYYITMDSGLVQNADESQVFKGLETDSLSFTIATSSLVFSEYIEGSSNNKALEVYNNTDHDINLDEYGIGGSYNGSGIQEDLYYFPTGAVLKSGNVFVLANSQADPKILAVTDDTLAYDEGGYVMSFNGNDARVLIRIMNNGSDRAWIDAIGDPNYDPGNGWDVAGVTEATYDHTLLRKADINIGTADWGSSAGTDATSSQWVVKDKDDFTNLGLPTSTQGINNIKLAKKVKLYPNPGSGIFNVDLNNTLKGPIIMKIMDMTGRVILKKSFNQAPNTIHVNISSLASNMYFFQINDQNNIIVKRFIKR